MSLVDMCTRVQVPLTPEASDLPGAGVTNGCEPPERGAGKRILQDQWAHSTDELSLQPTLARFLMAGK